MMQTYKGDNWMSPFGTQINCINTIDGECKRGLSLEECMKKCQDSNECDVGYFIETNRPKANQPSFCVPLSSFSWGNQNIFDILFSNQNPTNISTNNGLKYTLFYNDKKFRPINNLPNNFNDYLFSMNNVYFKYDSKTPLYMKDDFTFTKSKKDAIVLKISKVDRVFVINGIRLTKDMQICLFQDNFLVVLQVRPGNKIIWESVQPLKTTFKVFDEHKKPSKGFLNNLDKVYLQYKKSFLTVKSNKLVISKKISKFPFQFEKIPLADPNRGRKIYARTNDFYCTHFKNCKTPIKPLRKNHGLLVGIILLVVAIIIIWVFIVMMKI
jgi:hypothetical protein